MKKMDVIELKKTSFCNKKVEGGVTKSEPYT